MQYEESRMHKYRQVFIVSMIQRSNSNLVPGIRLKEECPHSLKIGFLLPPPLIPAHLQVRPLGFSKPPQNYGINSTKILLFEELSAVTRLPHKTQC